MAMLDVLPVQQYSRDYLLMTSHMEDETYYVVVTIANGQQVRCDTVHFDTVVRVISYVELSV